MSANRGERGRERGRGRGTGRDISHFLPLHFLDQPGVLLYLGTHQSLLCNESAIPSPIPWRVKQIQLSHLAATIYF